MSKQKKQLKKEQETIGNIIGLSLFLIFVIGFGSLFAFYLAKKTTVICVKEPGQKGECVFLSKSLLSKNRVSVSIDEISAIEVKKIHKTKSVSYDVYVVKKDGTDIRLNHIDSMGEKLKNELTQFDAFLNNAEIKGFEYSQDDRFTFYIISSAFFLLAFLLILGLFQNILMKL